jgi:hypothetical protein
VLAGENVTLTVFASPNRMVYLYVLPPNETSKVINGITNATGYFVIKVNLNLRGVWYFRAFLDRTLEVGSNPVEVRAYSPTFDESGRLWWEKFGSLIWGGLTTFWNTITGLWNGLTNAVNVVVNTIGGVGQAINASWTLIMDVWGNWGDSATYNQVLTLNLLFPDVMLNMSSSTQLSKVATTIIERCLKRGVAPPNFLNNWLNDNRTIDEVTPKGFMGIINMFISFAIGSKDIVEWILRNFILLHLVAIVGLLVFGVYGAIKKRDFDPIVQSCHYIYGIFALYVKVITWIISKAIDLAQAIAQWLDTIIPF